MNTKNRKVRKGLFTVQFNMNLREEKPKFKTPNRSGSKPQRLTVKPTVVHERPEPNFIGFAAIMAVLTLAVVPLLIATVR